MNVSSFKHTLGESVMAKKWPYIIREITTKVNVYNWLLDVSEEAINWYNAVYLARCCTVGARIGITNAKSYGRHPYVATTFG